MSLFDRLSRRKFHNENKSPDGTDLVWPGTPEGFPVRRDPHGGVPLMKGDETDEIPLRLDYDCGWFELTNEDDLRRFRVVMDHITSGVWLRLKRQDIPDNSTGKLRVFLEWARVEGEPGKRT